MLVFVLAACTATLISAMVVPLARSLALKKGLLDIPNERSSHKVPTPRTGGIGIVAGAIGGLGLALAFGGNAPSVVEWLSLGVLAAGAAVGFLDDVFDLPSTVRLLLYLACAAGLVYAGAFVERVALPGLPAIGLGHAVGFAFSVLFVAWYTNLFNFMDGIDGIAGCAAAVTMGALAVVFIQGGETFWAALSLACAGACVGFLIYNVPPASVFMGDGGAVFLGLAAGGLSLVAVERGHLALPAAVMLMLPFVFDATFTLFRRMLRRERFWAAHRTHVYQQMCDLRMSHRAVTSVYTVAALLCAALGLVYGSMPDWGKALAFWGAVTVLLFSAMFVLKKNSARSPVGS